MTQQRLSAKMGRPIKKTLYVVTALHVVVGFLIAIPAAFFGDRLSAFLGWLIIVVALAAAAVVNNVLRLGSSIRSAGQSLDELRERVERVERMLRDARESHSTKSETRMVDLAAMGPGDPSELVAASLDREAYPRLVTTMDDQPPAESAEPVPAWADHATGSNGLAAEDDRQRSPTTDTGGVTTRNFYRQWRLSLRNGDLAACREIFAVFVDTAESATVASMRRQLELLADRTEASLRDRFSRSLREQDYAGSLLVGEQICTLLPDRPVADEFKRLKPLLLRRYEQHATSQDTARLRVVR